MPLQDARSPAARAMRCGRIVAACCFVGLGVAATAERAAALTLHHTFQFDAARVQVAGPVDAARLTIEGCETTSEPGRPEIPFELVTLAVPPGSRLIGLTAQATGEAVVGDATQPVHLATLAAGASTLPGPKPGAPGLIAAAAPGGLYPAVLGEFSGQGTLQGYQLLSLRVYPVRWDPATLRVTAATRIDLAIELAPGGSRPLQRERYNAGNEADTRLTVERLVANPAALDGYDRRIGVRVEKAPGGFQPTAAPSLEGSDVDAVIITNDTLAPAWQVLADWKTRRGVPTVVRSVEWIQQNYRRGSDVQETVRTFIKDAYAKWAVRYVLMGGDTDVLPARYGFSTFSEPTEQFIPTDAYFACLDGNWNKDGDGIFGEAALGAADPGDSTDLYAEVFVGRGPFSTSPEVAAFVAKVMAYENPVSTNYQNKTLFLGEVLFPVGWDPSQAINLDGGGFCEEMIAFLGACNTSKRLYDNFAAYPSSTPLTLANTKTEINAGYGFVNHIGHGYRYNMSCGDVSYQNSDALAATNSDKRFVLYMLNCTATAFDFPCLGETFLKATGGAVGVFGASRSANPLASRAYNRGFMQAAYQQGYSHLGEAFVQSRIAQTPNAWLDTADHYSHMIYNYLGDPELVFHTCTLGVTAVTAPSSIGLGLGNITVHVTVGGTSRQGALVCLQKGTEEYQFGTTNVSGDAVLPFRAESAGSVQVTVSGQNMTTFLGTIAVTATAGAYVSNQSLTVDDNLAGNSNGNSDGVIDAGETIELSGTFLNSGNASASSPSGKLRIPSAWASVGDSTYSLSSISAGTTRSFTNSVRFTAAANTPDGTVLPLTFVTTSGTSTWTDVVNRVVHAPKMKLSLLDVDDSVTGNNDGVIQAGEVFDLVAYYKNYGTGAADGLSATLTSSDPDVVLTTSLVAYGRANSMQELAGATRFRLKENSLAENLLTMALTDSRARVLTSRITLRGPAPPAAPVLDASSGANVIELRWFPNAEADLGGYHVYRSTTGLAPWARVTLDCLGRTAYLRNTGLTPSTRYYYCTTAVDSSGNESAPSAIASINTNPAQLAGWPIGLGSTSSCSAAVGDINGDGSKEIVAGNDHLYAWSANGIEVLDDDSDPQTWGVFATEVHIVTGALALGEMNRNGHSLEVFVTSWDDSNKAFIVRGDGSMLPGWPQNPDFATAQKGYWGDSAVMDVDGDGLAEVWAPAKNGNLYAWHPNGTPVGAQAAFKSGLGTYMRCSPSFANVDGDPQKEIIFGAQSGTLYIWNADGTNVGTFPKTAGTSAFVNTAVGDINHDGILDVVFITEGGAVNVYNTRTGNQLPGFPVSLPVKSNPKCPSPALADFNFDGLLEIVVAFNHADALQSQLLVLNSQGQTLPGWPIITGGFTSESSPIVADVSGDGVPDIMFGNEGGLLYGWTWTGQSLPGFPLTVGDFIRSVPTAEDVDGDGGIDLVLMGWDKNLYIWDFPVPYNRAAAQWPMLKHDAQRSGLYGYRIDEPTDAGPGSGDPVAARAPQVAFLEQNVPNPFNPTTRIQYGIPAGAGTAVRVQLVIFDASGRQVRQLVAGSAAPGVHGAIWDGRDDNGHRVSSGLFFYRLQVAGQTLTRKLLLLK